MEYSALSSAIKSKEEEDKKTRDNVESLMKLNLRGQVFDTTKYTLLNGDSTYFSILLSSTTWELDGNGEYFIDRCGNGFDRVLDYMSTGLLSTEGLNRYDEDCVYDNLRRFKIPHKSRVWDYSRVFQIENLDLEVYLQLQDNRLCGSTDEHSICIYNMDTYLKEKTMKGHTQDIRDIIQLKDGRLCSCSSDTSIKLWDIGSGLCNLTINGHIGVVCCVLPLIDGRLCSGSYDQTIRIWDNDSGACQLKINARSSIFRIVQLRDGRIWGRDNEVHIRLWRLRISTGVFDMALHGHTSFVSAIVVVDDLRICSCSYDNTIKIWNVSIGVCQRTLEGHTCDVYDMVLLLDGRLCSVSEDCSIRIWTIETGVCDLTVYAGDTALNKVIQLKDGRLVVSDIGLLYIIGYKCQC
jgi:WD40 repeat protein